MKVQIAELTRQALEPASAVLGRAFDGDPLMRAFFSNTLLPAEQARLELYRFSCLVRFELGWPLLGVVEGGRVCAVACLTYPDFPGWTGELDHIYDELKQKIGNEATRKLERYSELVDQNRPREVHHFLAVLGVDPQDQGRGFGRMLLEEVQAQAASHPESTGVALDTENPRNLTFYKRFGYSLTAESTLEGTRIYHFFRPSSLDQPPHMQEN